MPGIKFKGPGSGFRKAMILSLSKLSRLFCNAYDATKGQKATARGEGYDKKTNIEGDKIVICS